MNSNSILRMSAAVQAYKSTFFLKKATSFSFIDKGGSCLSWLFDHFSIRFAQLQALHWAWVFLFPAVPLHRGLPTWPLMSSEVKLLLCLPSSFWYFQTCIVTFVSCGLIHPHSSYFSFIYEELHYQAGCRNYGPDLIQGRSSENDVICWRAIDNQEVNLDCLGSRLGFQGQVKHDKPI